jgi:hypothetical protein
MRPIVLTGLLAALVPALVAGCGGGSTSTAPPSTAAPSTHASTAPATTQASTAPVTAQATATAGGRTPAAFVWLHPGPAPAGWSLARLPNHAVLAYPSSWQRIHSDPQTASAARTDARTGLVEDYLNATPQQGEETQQNWPTFRPGHNKEEGDSQVQLLASARGLQFRDGPGSCVIDRYRTPRTTYQEIACLVRGPHGGNVVVAAAQAGSWAEAAPALEQAVSAFVA